jgi:hypothetical protein
VPLKQVVLSANNCAKSYVTHIALFFMFEHSEDLAQYNSPAPCLSFVRVYVGRILQQTRIRREGNYATWWAGLRMLCVEGRSDVAKGGVSCTMHVV